MREGKSDERGSMSNGHDRIPGLVETMLKLHERLSRMSLVRCNRTPVVHLYPNVLDCRESSRIIKETQ